MISYEPLLRTLGWKELKLYDLLKLCGFSSRTVAKIRKGESLTACTLERICIELRVPIHEVIEIIDDSIERTFDISNGKRKDEWLQKK